MLRGSPFFGGMEGSFLIAASKLNLKTTGSSSLAPGLLYVLFEDIMSLLKASENIW